MQSTLLIPEDISDILSEAICKLFYSEKLIISYNLCTLLNFLTCFYVPCLMLTTLSCCEAKYFHPLFTKVESEFESEVSAEGRMDTIC